MEIKKADATKNKGKIKNVEKKSRKKKRLVVVKNLDPHQKRDQTRKVLEFPIKKRQQKKEAYFAGIIDGEGIFLRKN